VLRAAEIACGNVVPADSIMASLHRRVVMQASMNMLSERSLAQGARAVQALIDVAGQPLEFSQQMADKCGLIIAFTCHGDSGDRRKRVLMGLVAAVRAQAEADACAT
jgi:hypothetical protein